VSGKLQLVTTSLATHDGFDSLCFDASGFSYDAPEDFGYSTSIKWAGIGLLQRVQYRLLTLRIAERQAGSSLETADLHGEPGSPVQKLQQLTVYFVYFRAPVFDIHGGVPFLKIPALIKNKKTSRDLFPFWESRLARLKAFMCWLLGLQHVTLTFRRPALPVGEEAVRKSEIEK
jgi:hypothetical protein